MSENNYNNFNQYQQPIQQPAQPVFPLEDASKKKSANTLGIVSLVLAPLSCCCCGVPSLVGVVLSIIGLSKNKGNVLCIIGLILNLLITAYMAFSTITTINDPAYMQYMQSIMEANGDPQATQEALNEFMQSQGIGGLQ